MTGLVNLFLVQSQAFVCILMYTNLKEDLLEKVFFLIRYICNRSVSKTRYFDGLFYSLFKTKVTLKVNRGKNCT